MEITCRFRLGIYILLTEDEMGASRRPRVPHAKILECYGGKASLIFPFDFAHL